VTDIAARYDAFQREAVRSIVDDFREARKGRFLLVIPTGGGKTKTAVKALGALYAEGVLADTERVMWVVHREELRTQALAAFSEYSAAPGGLELLTRVDVLMISQIAGYVAANPQVSFAVIDEAHHGAAASYQPVFINPSFGVLGLTATPSRHDGQPLPFDRESYSIGFPDLVRIGVLLQPHVEQVQGGHYDISDIDDDAEALEVLNNAPRNKAILQTLDALSDKLTKVILYVGTKKHAKDLFTLIRGAAFSSKFETLALILGGERRRVLTASGAEHAQEERSSFIASLKKASSALIVNVDVLTEGYDDPAVNAVVMARPTKSKLVYMQAIGRAVRLNPENLDKQAYIVEVVDELPNIRYRIDNRWLYSDVSDLLEPAVVDRFYGNRAQVVPMVRQAFEDFKVPSEYRSLPDISERDRVTMLLFKVYMGSGDYQHVPLVITNATRQAASSVFNFISSKMRVFKDLAIEASMKPVSIQAALFASLADPKGRKRVFEAMQNAFEMVHLRQKTADAVRLGHPWITFVALRLELAAADLSDDLLRFTEDMNNKESVREKLRVDAISPEFALAKFPLPLSGHVGVFLSHAEMIAVIQTADALRVHRVEEDGFKQWTLATSVLGTAALPIEKRYTEALSTIVREDLDYYRWLKPDNEEAK
jgi:superfamily II DNA or RNA helicase